MARRRDRQNELVVAVIVVSAMALALTFGIVLNLASRSGNNEPTSTPADNVLIGNNPSPTLPTVTPQTIETRPPTEPPDTPTYTPFPQPSHTLEASTSPTAEPSASVTPEPTATPTLAASDTPTSAPTHTASATLEPSPSHTIEVLIVEETLAPSETATLEPTTLAPSVSPTQRPSRTPQPTDTPTSRPSPTQSLTPSKTQIPTQRPSNTLQPTPTSTPSPLAPTRTLWPTRLPDYHLGLPTWTPTITPFPTATFTPFQATISATPNCEPPEGWVTYRVKRGDILFEIALQSGISTNALRQANCIEGSRIVTGQILYIPPNSPLATTATPIYQRQNCTTSTIQITSPVAGEQVGATITVRGVAFAEFFDYYTLGLRADNEPQFQEVYRQYQAVTSTGNLGTLPFNRPTGLYWLQLRVYNPWGDAVDSCEVPIIFN